MCHPKCLPKARPQGHQPFRIDQILPLFVPTILHLHAFPAPLLFLVAVINWNEGVIFFLSTPFAQIIGTFLEKQNTECQKSVHTTCINSSTLFFAQLI
jgi:ABC-type transport system involved in cytochrome bd biosynthesis fused ATPase/permease subunit